jgi:hypothetical protein
LWRNEGAAIGIAHSIHATRRWEDLPALADALEAAGCTDQEMLAHCRQPGKHSDACWVVQLLLGEV